MTPDIIAQAMAARTGNGLKLTWIIPASDDEPVDRVFTCYPKDAAQKAHWIEKYSAQGWELVPENATEA